MRTPLRTALLASLLSLLAFAPTAPAASDYLLELDGIKGESKVVGFEEAIEIESFSWGMQRAPATRTRLPSVRFQEISITKSLDKSSPLLMLRVAQGAQIPKAVISARTQEAQQPFTFLELCLQGVSIGSWQQSGSRGGTVTESFSLNFTRVVQKYRRKNEQGQILAPVTAGWDVVANLQFGTC